MSTHLLYPFQEVGAEWLTKEPFRLLADEMGLGKSAQTIRASDSIPNFEHALIICPAVARYNWLREIELWSIFPRKAIALFSLDERIPEGFKGFVVVSFEYANKNYEHLKERGRWDAVTIDEVHMAKSVDAKRTRAIFGKEGVVRKTNRVWVLSGTPAPNNVSELWVILYSFGVTSLKYTAFVDKYCDVIVHGYGIKIVGTKRALVPEIRAMLKSVMLRREVKAVLPDLPDISFQDIVVEAGEVEGLEEELQEKIEREAKKQSDNVLSLLDQKSLTDDERLKLLEGLANSVSTLRRYTGLQKVNPACELVENELKAKLYKKIVIFAIHRDVIQRMAEKLKSFGVVVVNGDATPEQKQARVDEFQNNPNCAILIGNIKSAGTNLTLTAAHHELFVELDWVPGNNAQAARRCLRIGQKLSVFVRFLSINNPIDWRVTVALKKKIKDLAEIFDN